MSKERVTLTAEPRTVVGKKVNTLRREGWVPAVIYGQGEPELIQVKHNLLLKALRAAGMNQLIDLKVGRKKHVVLTRDIQQHVTKGDLWHVDFMRVNMKETITTEVELVLVGESAPAEEGLGRVQQQLHTVEIECLPDALVSEIEVDLSQIKSPEDVIYVGDLAAPEGVTILTDPDTVVVSFAYTAAEEVAEEEEEEETFMPAADAVEVIGKGKKE
ncbi:MAG: 50S ribosomal protein L25, partial [Chloroflexi bacterium]